MLRRVSWTRPDWIRLNPTFPAIRSAVSATSSVAASAFASSDSQAIAVSGNKVTFPAGIAGNDVYVAFAVPEAGGDINSIQPGGGLEQITVFSKQAAGVVLDGVDHDVWVSDDSLLTSAIEMTTWTIGVDMVGYGQESFKTYARIIGDDDDGILQFILDAAIQEHERVRGASIGSATFIYTYDEDEQAPTAPPYYPPLKTGTTPVVNADERTYTYETQGVEDPLIREEVFNTALAMYEQRGAYKSRVGVGYGI